jgi:hypothetical protein
MSSVGSEHHSSRESSHDPDPKTSQGSDPKAPRSCLICYRRKIKCDKTLPCANCSKTGSNCVYPELVRQPRKPHRATIVQLNDRINRLEKTIIGLTGGHNHDQTGSSRQQPSPSVSGNTPKEGILVASPGASGHTFIGDSLYSSMVAEVNSI